MHAAGSSLTVEGHTLCCITVSPWAGADIHPLKCCVMHVQVAGADHLVLLHVDLQVG